MHGPSLLDHLRRRRERHYIGARLRGVERLLVDGDVIIVSLHLVNLLVMLMNLADGTVRSGVVSDDRLGLNLATPHSIHRALATSV